MLCYQIGLVVRSVSKQHGKLFATNPADYPDDLWKADTIRPYFGAISGSGALIKQGAGTLTLTGNSNAFAGTTTVHNARSLAIGTGGSLGAAGSSLVLSNASASVAFTNTSGTSTIGSTISGAGSLSKSGAGTGVITADNTYSGATRIEQGTLALRDGGHWGQGYPEPLFENGLQHRDRLRLALVL